MTVHAKTFYSWGGRRSSRAQAYDLAWRDDPLPAEMPRLAYGLGRSYGDSCLLNDGCLIETRHLDHVIGFNPSSGLLRCEAGCSLAALLEFCLPRGWFLPVTPGTKFVTVGGCVANDVHGKNHHRVGTFGCFVTRLGLRRSDGSERECSLTTNVDLFRATIGGLGLTGVILWVELQLKPTASSLIRQHCEPLQGLEAFFEVAARAAADFEYSVAWLDATHGGKPRGLFLGGNHSGEPRPLPPVKSAPRFSLPVTLPDFVLRSTGATRWLNNAYYAVNARRARERAVSYDAFFYPLDAVAHWNRAYGRKGLAQYQFVVPVEFGLEALREALGKVQAARQASLLTVVKLFGPILSPGLLSFPRPGVTVCFDFPYLDAATDCLFADLDRTVFAAAGALYPAKDFRMDQEAFERSFPQHREFKALIDPACSSNFARRTGLTA